jgi:hypothetical protein
MTSHRLSGILQFDIANFIIGKKLLQVVELVFNNIF